MPISQIVGWVGMVLALLAYYLISSKKVEGESWSFQLLNLVGASCIGVNALAQKAWPVLGLEVAWVFIAVLALAKSWKKKLGGTR